MLSQILRRKERAKVIIVDFYILLTYRQTCCVYGILVSCVYCYIRHTQLNTYDQNVILKMCIAKYIHRLADSCCAVNKLPS